MYKILEEYSIACNSELEDILRFWMDHTMDDVNGGFIGKIDHDNIKYPGAPKGSVLNSRILWTFSAAYSLTKNPAYLSMADRAYHYILQHFMDKEYGGVYWTVQANGEPLDTKKQIYAQAFAVYGLSEFYKASKKEEAKEKAIEIYHSIIKHSYDVKLGGYLEAFSFDWKLIDDLRLSDKDANEKKTMNTHLHVLEAFANLFQCWPDAELKKRTNELIGIFLKHIISPKTNHLILFFDEKWKAKSQIISYGHDIEAAWLIQEAAEVVGDEQLINKVKERSLLVAAAAMEGLDEDGGIWYEYDYENDHLVKEKHSWPQAEAMIGFFNAWQISGDEKWLHLSRNSWHFIKDFIKDKNGGEWYWGVNEFHAPMTKEDKVGIWKCPYHNSRACIEIIKRVNETIKEKN